MATSSPNGVTPRKNATPSPTGEEVYLYRANHNQYYIKTGEYFTDYTDKAPNGVTVHFKLKAADVEQNNVKGEKRFFLPLLKEIAWDGVARQLIIPFEYRLLTAQETITYGQKNQQEAIIAEAVKSHPPKGARPPCPGCADRGATQDRRRRRGAQPCAPLGAPPAPVHPLFHPRGLKGVSPENWTFT